MAHDHQDSQAVQWKDPKEETEREKLKARLAADTQAFGLLSKTANDNDDDVEEEGGNGKSKDHLVSRSDWEEALQMVYAKLLEVGRRSSVIARSFLSREGQGFDATEQIF